MIKPQSDDIISPCLPFIQLVFLEGKNRMVRKNKLLRTSFRQLLDPCMTDLGFEAAFPHYRRVEDGNAHLGEIQWGKNGGYFVFEFGRSELPFLNWAGETVPLEHLTVSHVPGENRTRICRNSGRNRDAFHYADIFDDAEKIEAPVAEVVSYTGQASEWLRTGTVGPNTTPLSIPSWAEPTT